MELLELPVWLEVTQASVAHSFLPDIPCGHCLLYMSAFLSPDKFSGVVLNMKELLIIVVRLRL